MVEGPARRDVQGQALDGGVRDASRRLETDIGRRPAENVVAGGGEDFAGKIRLLAGADVLEGQVELQRQVPQCEGRVADENLALHGVSQKALDLHPPAVGGDRAFDDVHRSDVAGQVLGDDPFEDALAVLPGEGLEGRDAAHGGKLDLPPGLDLAHAGGGDVDHPLDAPLNQPPLPVGGDGDFRESEQGRQLRGKAIEPERDLLALAGGGEELSPEAQAGGIAGEGVDERVDPVAGDLDALDGGLLPIGLRDDDPPV